MAPLGYIPGGPPSSNGAFQHIANKIFGPGANRRIASDEKWEQFMRTSRLISMKVVGRRFLRDESAATAIEYGLIASLIGVAIIAGAAALGTSLNSTFQSVSTTITGPSS